MRRVLALGAAAVTLTAAVLFGGPAQAAPPKPPPPSSTVGSQPKRPSLPPAREKKPAPPDFGRQERIATASAALTGTVTAAPARDPSDYDDCAQPDYSYLGNTYDCRAQAGEFLILFNIASPGRDGVPAVFNPNGRAKAVQEMLNSLSLAADVYRDMGFDLPADPDKPYVLVYGADKLPPITLTAPVALPVGLNQRPVILVTPGRTDFDSLPRHELFHVVQYQYWDDAKDVLLDFAGNWLGGDDFASMNWWMEATAEWAAHQTYVRTQFDPRGEAGDYADAVWQPLSNPGQPLNKWDGLAGSAQYGSVLFAVHATERTGPNFVRQTWEEIRDHDRLPINAIWQVVGGRYTMEIDDLLLDYHIANYRLARASGGPPTDDWSRFGYRDPDTTLWRTLIAGGAKTAGDGLGPARPARTTRTVPAGSHFELHNTLHPGGAVYHDFWAENRSGDPDCDYCSTLLVDTSKDPDRRSALVVWSPTGSSGMPDYPTITDVKYPDSGGLISYSGFRYPMVATLVTVRTDLNAHSKDAGNDDKTLDTYVETTAPLKERSCNLRAPVVQSVTTTVEPEGLFNSYAATTPRGWTGGDSTYSVKLPDGRTVWLFSDTWLGPLNADGTRPTSAPLVNNTFVVQNGSSLTTYHGGTAAAPRPLMEPTSDTTWYWIGDGHLSGGRLQVVFQEYKRFGPGAWDWGFNRNVVADFELSNLREPVRVRNLPSASGVAWGSALLPASRSGDGYTYVYGVNDAPINKQMRIARVQGSDLASGTWQYYTPWGWTFREQNARNTLTGIANEYSVTPWAGQFLLLSQDSTAAFSGQIMGYTSCSPFGPFTGRTQIHRMPEPGPYGSYWDGDIIAYNAHVHAGLSSGNTFLASYNVNSMDTTISPEGDHFRDPGIYRPRFFRFTLS